MYMEEEQNGLRSIERSTLSGARSRKGRGVSGRRRKLTNGRVDLPERGGRKGGRMKRYAVLVVLLLAALIFLLSTTFATGSLHMTLTSADLTVDGVFSAIREPAQSADISYGVRGPYTETREAAVTSITRERQNTRATGTITVYNAHRSGERLDLVNRTRFQTENGRIYRLIGKQIIPGGRTVDGELVPGEKEVKVEADSVGDEYNLPEKGVQFTIPGLVKYKAFDGSYAMSETRIVGGFSGERFIPDPKEAAEVREQLRYEIERMLRETLTQSLDTNSLSERVVFEDGVFIEYESLEDKQTESGVVLREKGILRAISFREAELAALLSRFASGSVPGDVPPANVDTMNLTIDVEENDDFAIASSKEFSFRLSGVAKLFWSIDASLFLSDVAGKNRAEVDDLIIREYPQVTRINEFSVFPIWRTTMPGNKDKVRVETEYGSGE